MNYFDYFYKIKFQNLLSFANSNFQHYHMRDTANFFKIFNYVLTRNIQLFSILLLIIQMMFFATFFLNF